MAETLKEKLNDDIRAEIAAIDIAAGPLRARVAGASEKLIRIIMPQVFGDTLGDRRLHDNQAKSFLVAFALNEGAPAPTVHDAQAIVLADFTRSLLETDFRRDMATESFRPFGYLVRCVRNRAVELWRSEQALGRRHLRAAHDAALAPDPTVSSTDDVLCESEEVATKLADLQRVPPALQALDRDELLLLVLSAALRLHRDRIGDILGITANAAGQRLRRLRDRLHEIIYDGPRAPHPGRSRGGKASARKQASRRRRRDGDP